jgi:hypothetical protein
MDRGLHFAGSGLEFAPVSEPTEAVFGGIEKNMSTPRLGDARGPFRCHYSGAIGRNSQSHLISTREAACRKFLVAVSALGFEVLVNYALNSIELTNPFLRFPRVRQQARGNFSFQWGSRAARSVIRFPR